MIHLTIQLRLELIISVKDKLPKKSAQCNIVIGCILENLKIFKKSQDIYAEFKCLKNLEYINLDFNFMNPH